MSDEIPKKIFIQFYGMDGELSDGVSPYTEEITWCQDKIGKNDIEYVRKDLAGELAHADEAELIKSWKYADEQLFRSEIAEAKLKIAVDALQKIVFSTGNMGAQTALKQIE